MRVVGQDVITEELTPLYSYHHLPSRQASENSFVRAWLHVLRLRLHLYSSQLSSAFVWTRPRTMSRWKVVWVIL